MDLYAEILRIRNLASDEAYNAQRNWLVSMVGERAYLAVARMVNSDLWAKANGDTPLANWELDLLTAERGVR